MSRIDEDKILSKRVRLAVKKNGSNIEVSITLNTLLRAAHSIGKNPRFPLSERREKRLALHAAPALESAYRWAKREDRPFNEAAVVAYLNAHS